MKKYQIDNEGTLWGNDYGREDALNIIEKLNMTENDQIIISFSPEIDDVLISYVEGFFNIFSKTFSKEFCKKNIVIDSSVDDIVIPFAKYITSTYFEQEGIDD